VNKDVCVITPGSRHVVWIKKADAIARRKSNFLLKFSTSDNSLCQICCSVVPIVSWWTAVFLCRYLDGLLYMYLVKFLLSFFLFSESAFTVNKNVCVITPGSRHVVWIKICDDIPNSPEVIDVHTLNFKPNFKFSRLKFFGGPPSQLGCALRSLGQYLARVKILGHSTP